MASPLILFQIPNAHSGKNRQQKNFDKIISFLQLRIWFGLRFLKRHDTLAYISKMEES